MLIKIWLEVGMEEQERRFAARVDDPLRQWKLSPMDVESYSRWYDYSRARDAMLKATDSKHAPWVIVHSDDKRRGAAQLHRAHPATAFPTRRPKAGQGEAAAAIPQGRLRRSGVAEGPEVRGGALLALRPDVTGKSQRDQR